MERRKKECLGSEVSPRTVTAAWSVLLNRFFLSLKANTIDLSVHKRSAEEEETKQPFFLFNSAAIHRCLAEMG